MKVKVIYTTTAEIEVSDHYAEMPKLHEKESALAWYVWKALADSLDRELTWKLSKIKKSIDKYFFSVIIKL